MNKDQQQFDGYHLIPNDSGIGYKMVLEGAWRPQYKKAILKQNVTGLRLSHSNGWKETNILFIVDLVTLRDLEIYSWDITDASPIESLPKLEKISLECNYRKPINFATFQHLQYCFLRWRPKADSLFSLSSLKALNIVNYPYEDLIPLKNLTQLTKLQLTSNKLKGLNGVKNLELLTSLDLYKCTKLESLKGIQDTRQLTKLEVESCTKIEDLEPLSTLIKLTKASLNNCGKLQSLLPLKSCTNLTELFFIESTNIEDGNINIFKDLPILKTMWFANRRHYSHKRENVQEAIKNHHQ